MFCILIFCQFQCKYFLPACHFFKNFVYGSFVMWKFISFCNLMFSFMDSEFVNHSSQNYLSRENIIFSYTFIIIFYIQLFIFAFGKKVESIAIFQGKLHHRLNNPSFSHLFTMPLITCQIHIVLIQGIFRLFR